MCHRLRVLRRDETGIALVMALGIMLVLTIALTTVIALTADGARDAGRTNAAQKAHSLAEAGVNNALAQLTAYYPSALKQGTSGGSLSGGPTTYDGVTVSWSGAFNPITGRWELVGTGTVKNPTGGSNIVRTATAKISLTDVTPYSRFGIYASDPTAGCTTLAGGISVNVPVYVASCLTTNGNYGTYPAKIWEPNTPASVFVQVGGTLTVNNNAPIGTTVKPIKFVAAGSIVGAGNIHAGASPALPLLGELHVDAQAIYSRANWSGATCTLGTQPFDNDNIRNNSKLTINLLTLNSYTNCIAKDAANNVIGKLSWNQATKQMVIDGTIFFDGDLNVGTNDFMQYSGSGTIYFNGKVNIQGVLCGPGLQSIFDAVTGSCNMKWDPNEGTMMIVAANAAGLPIAGPPALSWLDPGGDGANTWTHSTGTTGYGVLDEGVRSPTVPGNDRVESSTLNNDQEVVFPDTMVHEAGATYTLWMYTIGGNRRGANTFVSVNDSTYPTAGPTITTGSAATWRSQDISTVVNSQLTLNGLRVRLRTTATNGGGSPTPVQVYEIYLEKSVPTFTTSFDPLNAFVVSSGSSRLEVATWTVGNFSSTGQGQLGGSVLVERGFADIQGGGLLKAFVTLPAGAPSFYGLADAASDFG